MTKKTVIILILTGFIASVSGKQNFAFNENPGVTYSKKAVASISGHTIDRKTDAHIGFINISVKGTTLGVATDATGHFLLKNIPEGEHIIVASAVGYKTLEKKIVLKNGRTTEMNFELEEDAVMLDNIVVSANRSETKRSETSSIVNVISSKLFETTNAVCLAQGLSFQPGLRVENNCQNCGFQQVRINGLEGPYSQILIDSRPIFSALAGVYGIEQIPANMIDRVEVVRGGGSALFGSNAIAGTINIITREPLNNSLSISNTSMLIGGSKTDINTNMNAALVSEDYKAGVSIYGSARQREGWDANGDGFTEIGLINARNVGFRSYFKPGLQNKITLEYHNMGEFRRGGNKLHLPAHNADITEQTEHNINSGGIKWDVFSRDYTHRFNVYSSAQHIDRSSYYGAGQDPNAYGSTTDIAFVTGMQYVYAMEKLLFMPAEITAGAEYSHNRLVDVQLAYDRQIDQTVNIKSAFLQNEWKNKKAGILLGLRFDQHNLIEKPIISPRVNFRYNPYEWVNLRATYASGFRAPQAFDEDLHIDAVGGTVKLIEIADALRPEYSHTFSTSLDYYFKIGRVETNLLVEGFSTRINDIFILVDQGENAAGQIIMQRQNGSGARVSGVNLEGKIAPSTRYQLQFGYTLQKSLYDQAERWSDDSNVPAERKLLRTPDQYGYFNMSYNVTKKLLLNFTGTYTGSMLAPHFAGYITSDRLEKTPSFADMNLKATYDVRLNGIAMQLSAGAKNIFNSYQTDLDKGALRDAGYVYGPSLPRSFFVGLKFSN